MSVTPIAALCTLVAPPAPWWWSDDVEAGSSLDSRFCPSRGQHCAVKSPRALSAPRPWKVSAPAGVLLRKPVELQRRAEAVMRSCSAIVCFKCALQYLPAAKTHRGWGNGEQNPSAPGCAQLPALIIQEYQVLWPLPHMNTRTQRCLRTVLRRDAPTDVQLLPLLQKVSSVAVL